MLLGLPPHWVAGVAFDEGDVVPFAAQLKFPAEERSLTVYGQQLSHKSQSQSFSFDC